MDVVNEGGTVGKRKKNRKNASRKHRRNYRWEYVDHSQTKYRSRGTRDKNKARRAVQRERRLSVLRNKRNAVHFKDYWTEEAVIDTQGSGNPQR